MPLTLSSFYVEPTEQFYNTTLRLIYLRPRLINGDGTINAEVARIMREINTLGKSHSSPQVIPSSTIKKLQKFWSQFLDAIRKQ